MAEIGSRIKTIDITRDGEVLGTAKFNPNDVDTYRRFLELEDSIRKAQPELDALSAELTAAAGGEPGDGAAFHENREIQVKLLDRIDAVFADLKRGVDGIFGEGIYDIATQGYKDPDMLMPLFDEAMPIFRAARGATVEAAKLNRAERRALKK